MRKRHAFTLLILAIPWVAVRADDQRHSTVGMPARIDQLILPGSELEVKPLDDRKLPVVLRIAAVFPHGSAYRYDLVYYGLDPGTFDLKDYLRRKDGSSTSDLPALTVEIQTLLPPGQVRPHDLETASGRWLGGYSLLLVVGGIVWLLGLPVILLVGRKRRTAATATSKQPVTMAERLRPYVEAAQTGSLSTAERAELERLLLTYWRRRLRLEDAKPQEAFAALRQHPDAGPLLQQLEDWLHRPQPAREVDVAALLRAYATEPVA